MAATNKKSAGGSEMANDDTPEWVKGMHAYHHANGFYRPSDILRVLGDQDKSVEVPVIRELAAARVENEN